MKIIYKNLTALILLFKLLIVFLIEQKNILLYIINNNNKLFMTKEFYSQKKNKKKLILSWCKLIKLKTSADCIIINDRNNSYNYSIALSMQNNEDKFILSENVTVFAASDINETVIDIKSDVGQMLFHHTENSYKLRLLDFKCFITNNKSIIGAFSAKERNRFCQYHHLYIHT